MLCSDNRIRGKSMYINDISRQQFSKIASRGFAGRMTLTGRGLVLGAGTLLAKFNGKPLPIAAEQERIWTLLSVAYGHGIAACGLGIAPPRGKTLARRRQMSRRDSSGADGLAGHRRGRRLSPGAGGGADRRGRRASRACPGAGVRSPRRSSQIRSGPAARACRKREGKRRVDVIGGCRVWGCGGIAADRGEIGGKRAGADESAFRQTQGSTRPSQGCDRCHAAGRHSNRRSSFSEREAHGSATGKLSRGVC